MKSLLKNLLIILTIGISFFACKKDDPEVIPNQENDYEMLRDSIISAWDSLRIQAAYDITQSLQGTWMIDTLEIEFQDSYFNSQAGIFSDTTFVDFGEISFGKWEQLFGAYPDSTSYKNEGELLYKGQIFPINFNYLLHHPWDGKVFSFMDRRITQGGTTWDTTEGWYLDNLGIQDNIEIVKMNEDEYYLRGSNRGIKKMKLRRR